MLVTASLFALIIGNAYAANAPAEFKIQSSAFAANKNIPAVYTCHGKNISIPLQWEGVPSGTKSLALIMDDPDAPSGLWVHWVVFNIPASTTEFKEDINDTLKNEQMGKNSWGKARYDGPCPPSGTHRYVFHLYALDDFLNVAGGITAAQLREAMRGHIIAQTQLIGTSAAKPR